MSITTEIQQCQDEAREGWMPEKKSAPDFGEPWKTTNYRDSGIVTSYGRPIIEGFELVKRAVACVNACAGMSDPAKEIQAMQEAIKEAWIQIQYAEAGFAGLALRVCPNDSAVESVLNRIHEALAKLQPFLP